MSINSVTLIGRVGKDVEVKDVNGTKCAVFTLATGEKYKDKSGEMKEITDWHNIVVWRQAAEIVEKFVKKGDQICVLGKIRYRSWDTPNGEKRYITEIVADRVELLGSKGGQQESQPSAPQASQAPQRRQVKSTPIPGPGDGMDDDGDLPF